MEKIDIKSIIKRLINEATVIGMGVGPQQHIEIIYKTLEFCIK